MDPAGRTALVTGAAIGTGRAIAVALARAGARVVVTDVSADDLAETAALAPMATVVAELLDADARAALVAEAAPAILVNNAGGGGHVPPHFPDAAPDEWGATLDLNLRVPMHLAQLALPGMRAAGGGAIVNVGSSAGLETDRYASPEYGAAKAGLVRFTSAFGARDGVHMVCVVPNWVATERVPPEDVAAADPPLVPVAAVADAVLRAIRDPSLAGRAIVLDRGAAPRVR